MTRTVLFILFVSAITVFFESRSYAQKKFIVRKPVEEFEIKLNYTSQDTVVGNRKYDFIIVAPKNFKEDYNVDVAGALISCGNGKCILKVDGISTKVTLYVMSKGQVKETKDIVVIQNNKPAKSSVKKDERDKNIIRDPFDN